MSASSTSSTSPRSEPETAQYLSFPAHGAPTTCRYAGKKCLNLRALKRNGSLHNLCHYHRVRANQNQRRMELRRRIKRVHDESAMSGGMPMMMHPAYLPVHGGSSSVHASHTIGSFSELMRSEPRVNYGLAASLAPASAMLAPQENSSLSDLFSPPEFGSYIVDLPFVTKQDARQQFPDEFPVLDHLRGSFASRAPLVNHEQVVWCDQEFLL